MVVHAIAQEHDLDVQAERDGANYILVCTETAGDLIVAEHRLQIVFDDLPEVVKLFVLRVYLQGVLGGCARWRRRTGRRLAALGVGRIG